MLGSKEKKAVDAGNLRPYIHKKYGNARLVTPRMLQYLRTFGDAVKTVQEQREHDRERIRGSRVTIEEYIRIVEEAVAYLRIKKKEGVMNVEG